MTRKNDIISELLNNSEHLRPGQVDFINSVRKYKRRYKKISDKQLFILKEIRSGLNEKLTAEAGEVINSKYPEMQKINKEKPRRGNRGNERK